MPKALDDPVLVAFANGAMWLSLATGLCLLVARSRGPLLTFQPRRLVPWNAVGAALACVIVLLIVVSALELPAAPVPMADANAANADASASKVAANLGAWIVQEVFLVGSFLLLITVYFKATRRDLGLPANLHEFRHDVLIGIIAGMAALAPIFIIQTQFLRLLHMPEMESGNPLIKSLRDGGPNIGMLLLATFATVVVAPICEEITFRLLLQGWLEKWETEELRLCDVEPLPDVTPTDSIQLPDAMQMPNAEWRMTNEGNESNVKNSSFDIRHSALESPPAHGVAGLPFSWLPITISSLLFGLAHIGYGPEPVPLFFLALVLGYVYYRTHRIVPCIVCHAVFNSFTMFVLWRLAFHSAQ